MSRTDPQFNLRIPEALRDKVMAAAKDNKRSATAEVLARLEESFERDLAQAELSNRLYSAKENREEGQSEAAAVMMQGIEEIKAKIAEFQRMVESVPLSDPIAGVPETSVATTAPSHGETGRRVRVRKHPKP